MTTLTNLPEHKQLLVEQLVGQLSRVSGVAAVALGGSYAAGTQHAASDIDLGLYYLKADPFAITEIRRIADSVATQGATTVTDFYVWGPWVNGGAWIHTDAGKVDFLYRNLNQVQQTIEEAQQGRVSHHDDPQPAYGFYVYRRRLSLAKTEDSRGKIEHECTDSNQELMVRLAQHRAEHPGYVTYMTERYL